MLTSLSGAADTVAGDEMAAFQKPWWRSALGPLATGAVLLVAIALLWPSFFQNQNLTNVLRAAAILGLVTLGQTFVLLVGGIDLSVGAVMSFGLVLLADVSRNYDTAVAVIVVLTMSLLVGSINGVLVTLRAVPPFVATLGMSIVVAGASLAYTKGVPAGDIPASLRPLGTQGVAGIPYAFVLWIAVAASVWFVLRKTRFGYHVYATGTSVRGARLAGIRTTKVTFLCYVLGSFLAAVGGIVLSAYAGYIDEYIGTGYDLDSIAAAIIGGVSFAGGEGSVLGVVAGVLFVTVLLNLVILAGLDPNLQLVVRGTILILAVAVFVARHRFHFSLRIGG